MTEQAPTPRVALVGAGPGDPELWTVRAVSRIADADLVLYDALVDVDALRRMTRAQCFCVGKRARRDSVPQAVINRLLVSAARKGKRVVRLKGGDPFVFGRGGEEAMALAGAGIPFEIVPGVTTAVAAAELVGIPVTHRGVASAFLVMAGHTSEMVNQTLASIQPDAVSVIVMMGLGVRDGLTAAFLARGWTASTPAAIVCAASLPQEWVWTGTLAELPGVAVPDGLAGVLVIGDVVRVRAALHGALGRVTETEMAATAAVDEVMYGRH